MEGELKMANTNKTIQIVRLANEIAELQDTINKQIRELELTDFPSWVVDKINYIAGYAAALKAGEVAELNPNEWLRVGDNDE